MLIDNNVKGSGEVQDPMESSPEHATCMHMYHNSHGGHMACRLSGPLRPSVFEIPPCPYGFAFWGRRSVTSWHSRLYDHFIPEAHSLSRAVSVHARDYE